MLLEVPLEDSVNVQRAFVVAVSLVSFLALQALAAEDESLKGLAMSPAQASAAKHDANNCCKSKSLETAAWEVIRENVRSDGKSRRTKAVAALQLIGARPDILPLLQGALHDKDSVVRRDSAIALGELQAREARHDLRALLDDDSPEVGFAAASALEAMGDHSGREIFIATLEGERKGDGFIKAGLKGNVQKYRDPKYLAFVGAKEAAGALFGPLSMGVVIAQELMKDHTASARAHSATLLAKDPSPDAVSELKLALADKNWAVRAAAAQALAKSPGEVEASVFEPLLIDDNDMVRAIAAASIIRLSRAARPKELHWPAAAAPAPRVTVAAGHP